VLTCKNIGYLGRLGNQMFQFASVYGISKSLGFDVKFPIENCFNYRQDGPRNPKTGHHIPVKCDLLDCFQIPNRYFAKYHEINPKRSYSEKDFTFNPAVLSVDDFTDFFGYFQTEKYFQPYREELLDIFKFREEHISAGNKFLDQFGKSPEEMISLHVRRMDYTLYPDHHPTCSSLYYDRALENMEGKKEVLVFSDDTEWSLTQFRDPRFHVVDLNDPYTELYLMSKCGDNIIANSSFSWWGAWLNLNNEKKVIAPSQWFGAAMNKDTRDIYSKDWIII
jgi:hypothetical protein